MVLGIALVLTGQAGADPVGDCDLGQSMTGQPKCGTNRVLGGATETTCAWSFDYRAKEAKAHFDWVQERLQSCYHISGENLPDHRVNHPDSYTLWQFYIEDQQISLSLKDKAALRQSLVFLRWSDL